MTTRLPKSRCLSCSKELDAASHTTSGNIPKPGDMTVCLYCGHLMIFTEEMTFRAPTDAEQVEIAGDPGLIATMEFIKFYHAQKAKEA